eukprot:gene8557-17648_t
MTDKDKTSWKLPGVSSVGSMMKNRLSAPFGSKTPAITSSSNFISKSVVNVDDMFTNLLSQLDVPEERREVLSEALSTTEKTECLRAAVSVIENDPHFLAADEDMIRTLKMRKNIGSISVLILKQRIATADKDWLAKFCVAGGLSVLVESIDGRLHTSRFLELDAAALFELLHCMKGVMKSGDGLTAVLATRGAVDAIIMSLNFKYKPLALLVLEILSVALFFSQGKESGDMIVWQIMQGVSHLAKRRKEKPFALFVTAMKEGDAIVRSTVLEFVIFLLISESDFTNRIVMRDTLQEVEFQEVYSTLVSGKSFLNEGEGGDGGDLEDQEGGGGSSKRHHHRSMLKFLSSDSERIRVDAKEIALAEDNCTAIHPLVGVMAGYCIRLRSRKSTDYFTAKDATKRRWHSLSNGKLTWWGDVKKRQV